MADRQFAIKWTTSKRSSKELVISGPLELGQISRRDVGPQVVRDHLSGSSRRDSRKISEGPRSRSLDTRAFDGIVQQRHVNSQISRDISALSESKRRSADTLAKDGEGNLIINELFKREFIEKLSERAKHREPDVPVPVDLVKQEHFVKPIKIHPRHGRSESGDLIQVIGSPKRDSFERVRVIELPRTPRSPLHEKSKSPFADKFKDPEWIAKCEKLNVDHPDHHDHHQHKRALSGADANASGETSRDFILSKFFDNPASKASPRDMYDILSTEEQDQLSADVLPTSHHSLRRMASRRSLLVDEEIAQRGKPFGKILAGDDLPRSSTSSVASGSKMTSPDLNPDKESPAAILRESMAKVSSRRMSLTDPRIRKAQEDFKAAEQAIQVDFNSEEVIRTKETMLKSLRAAAAVDQAHFLRTLQDQGAVQSSSPLRPTADFAALVRSPSRGSDSPNFVRSPMTPTISKFPSPPTATSENVREVKGNAVEGSLGDFLARASPAGGSTPTQDGWEESKRPVDVSKSTIASRVAARRRRSLSQEAVLAVDKEGRKTEQLPVSSTEMVLKAVESPKESEGVGSPQSSSTGVPNFAGKSTILQKFEKSRERRRRRAEKEAAQKPSVSGGSTLEQDPSTSKVNHSASKSWSVATSYIFGGKSPDDIEEVVNEEENSQKEVKENLKESIIQKLMKRASARQAIARQNSCEAQDLQQERENVSQNSGTKQESFRGSPVAAIEGILDSSSDSFGATSSPKPEAGSSLLGENSAQIPIQRNSNHNRSVSPIPSPKSEDPGPLKSPLSSIESSSNAEDISGLLADLTGSVGLALGSSPSSEGVDSSIRVNVRSSPGQPQTLPESECEAGNLETVVQTPERTLPAGSGPCWSPGSDDSGSDGSSLDNQPSPVSVLNNSRTPFAEEGKLESIESKINLLDQKLQESHERSQKLSVNSVSRRPDDTGKTETAPFELIDQEIKIVELNPEGTPLRKSIRPAKAAAAKCEVVKAVPCPPDNRYKGGQATPAYEHRKSREIAHRHASPGATVGSRGGHCEVQATDFRRSLEIIAGSASDFRKSLEIFDLENIPTRGRRKWDLVYARDVLVASGFGRDVPSGPMTKWHSVSEPVDPSLFENMEDYYKTGQKFLGCERLRRLAFYQPDHSRLAERIQASLNTKQGRYEPMHRCHLFDVVNELLAKKLGPYRNPRNPWLTSSVMRPRPTGKMLLEEIWRDITDQIGRNGSIHYDQRLLHLQLENMIGEDLYKRSHWFPSPDFDAFVERIVAELEKRIFHDLVLETVATLQSI